MKILKSLCVLGIALLVLPSCKKQNKQTADLVIYGGPVYTSNNDYPLAEAVAISGDRIVYVGEEAMAKDMIDDSTRIIDLQGKMLTAGLIESHAHIMDIGYNILHVNLSDVANYDELVEKVADAAKEVPPGQWILGRGWHQDKWEERPEKNFKGFPTHHQLSKMVPDHPVLLKHASGHASLANTKAMEVAGVTKDTPHPVGGEIFMGLNGEPTGIFNETASSLVERVIPSSSQERKKRALELAIQECLKNGITSFHNAGAGTKDIELFKTFAKTGDLKIRLYSMLDGKDSILLSNYFEKGPLIGAFNNFLTIRAIKLYADGALGSRGAWLLEEYSDAPGKLGHNVVPLETIRKITKRACEKGFQVCIHAIGDRANQEVLDIFENVLTNSTKTKDHRFRIEHAQHIDIGDIPRFSELEVIASMQAIHMSSDRPWAIDRLGRKRITEGAYVWQKLLSSGAKVINGTDAPVEPLNPIACFYSSITRKTLEGKPENGYEVSQRMTREQALRSYTIDAAYGAFEEDIKGSIEVGKLADFTIFSQDIMKIPEDQLLDTKVFSTIVGGQVVYVNDL